MPLSPKAKIRLSTQLAAVKAVTAAAPMALTALWTSSLPKYRLDCCKADTEP